jgi:hypothetical protein
MNERNSLADLAKKPSDPIRGLFIDGTEQLAGSRETSPIVSPGTGKVIAHTVNANGEDVDAAIASARRAFEGNKRGRAGETRWPKYTRRSECRHALAVSFGAKPLACQS